MIVVQSARAAITLETLTAPPAARSFGLTFTDDEPPGLSRNYYGIRAPSGTGTWALVDSYSGTGSGGTFIDDDVPLSDDAYDYMILATYDGVPGLEASNTEVFQRPFPISVDSVTQKTVLQLTEMPGDNYPLYFEFSNSNRGYLMVFRNLFGGQVSYYALDLRTGDTSQITPPGLCNVGVVHQYHLYAACVPGTSGNYTQIRRYALDQSGFQTLCDVEPMSNVHGSLDVNRDGSFLIFAEEDVNSSERRIVSCEIATRAKREQVPLSPAKLAHLRFHRTNYNIFYYHRPDNQGIARIGMGRILEGDFGPLSHVNPGDWLNDPDHTFVHPFSDQGGSLWSDVWPERPYFMHQPYDVVRMTLDESTRQVTGYDRFQDIPAADWQNHFGWGPTPLTFVGDGLASESQSSANCDDTFINAVTLNAWLTAVAPPRFDRLARGIGTCDNPPPFPADDEPNAHYIQAMQWVVWAARRTLDESNQGNSVSQNIFAVPYFPVYQDAP